MDGNLVNNKNKKNKRRKPKDYCNNIKSKYEHRELNKFAANNENENNDDSCDDQDIYEKVFSLNINDEFLNDEFNDTANNFNDKQFYSLHEYKTLNLQ